jgi:hypothetical protein
MRHALVIGGTGMLAGAVREIAGRAEALTLIARAPERLAAETGAEPLAMDWADRVSVAAALAHLAGRPAPDLMISWIHRNGLWCLTEFEALLAPGARSIRVHGSATGDPAGGVSSDPAPPAGVRRQDVVLGWVNEPGGRRWLTNAEICAGVLEALDRPERRAAIVGTLS